MSPLFYFFLLHKRREHQSRPPITWRVPQMKYSMSLIGLALFRVGVTTDRMTLASKACQCVRCLLYCLHGPLYSLHVRDPRPKVAGMCSDLSAPMHGVLGAGAESDLLARIGGKEFEQWRGGSTVELDNSMFISSAWLEIRDAGR